MYAARSVAVIVPAFNEAACIREVVSGIRGLRASDGSPLVDDVVVCDNGSDDGTGALAAEAGARVVVETTPGYGAACWRGMQALDQPDLVVFVDGDHSVAIDELPRLLEPLCGESDLVIGSRTLGRREPGALTPQQRLGNWLASRLIRRFWGHPTTDLGPFRAIRFPVLQALGMRDRAYGWTVEMQVQALRRGFVVSEVPSRSLRRVGRSKISGTLRGTLGAARGILGTIARLRAEDRRTRGDAA